MSAKRYNQDCLEARATLAHKVGASRLFLLACPASAAVERLEEHLAPALLMVCKPLDGTPVACTDLKELGKTCRERGEVLVVDDTLPGPLCCDALRLGGHLLFVALDDMLSLVAVSRDALELLNDIEDALTALPQADDTACMRALELIDAQVTHWRNTSDAAQVIASYLRCHPVVSEVRYPGLRDDASYEVAARTLIRGFGPLVDYRIGATWHRYSATETDVRDQVLALESYLSGFAFSA